jgi:predicted esterase
MLHGMTSSPSRTCARVEAASDMGMVVLCPTGNVDYGDGTADWTGDGEVKAAHLDRALAAGLAPLSLAPAAERGDVLMGFSRGAFVARDVAYERPGKWSGLVLIGAALMPDAEKLRGSGIRRVVLASGDFDGAKRTMVAARAKLCAAGMPARFVGLGPVWHALPEDSMARLEGALAWARGEGSDETPGCTPSKS